jgi:hypothetical protein
VVVESEIAANSSKPSRRIGSISNDRPFYLAFMAKPYNELIVENVEIHLKSVETLYLNRKKKLQR